MTTNNALTILTAVDNLDNVKIILVSIKYFVKLFEIGNSIRGWKGEGPYYPLDIRPKSDNLDNVYIALISFNELSIMDELKYELDYLPTYTYNNKETIFSQNVKSIRKVYNSVVEGQYPTLMTSDIFMTTAIYYLKERYNYIIKDVDITTLQKFC